MSALPQPASPSPPFDPRPTLLWLVGVVAVLTALVAMGLGLVLRADAWSSDGALLEISAHERISGQHAAAATAVLALGLGLICLLRLSADTRLRSGLAIVGAGALVLAAPLSGVYLTDAAPPLALASAASAIVAALGVLLLVAASARPDLGTVILAGAGVSLLGSAIAALLQELDPSAWARSGDPALTVEATLLALFALSVCEAGLSAAQRRALGLALAALLATSAATWLGLDPGLALRRIASLAIVIVIGLVVRAARASDRPLGARIALVIATLVAGASWWVEPWLATHAPYVADTTLPIGILHLRVIAVICAVLATVEAPWRTPLGLVALSIFATGGAALGGAWIALGLAGMPMRYARYLEALEPLHRLCSVSAQTTALGALALAIAVLAGARRHGAPSVPTALPPLPRRG